MHGNRHHPAARPDPLELRLLASGATQHVFLRIDDPDDGWVYKTPAIMDALLPSPISMGRLALPRGGQRVVYSLFYRIPRGFWRRLHAHPRPLARRASLLLGGSLARRYVGLANRLLSLYLRRSRTRAFRRMLRIHGTLAERDAADCFPPWRELPLSRATLHAAGTRRIYRGPILAQRRADVFFESCEGLERLDWAQLVHVQHRLWRKGVALADAAGVLGPQGWALLGDRVLLADTGSLTEDFGLAIRVLSPERLAGRWQRQLRRQPDEASRQRARAYYEAVLAHINQDRLLELWRADRPGRPGRTQAGWVGSSAETRRERRE